jgi:hypothetical protein
VPRSWALRAGVRAINRCHLAQQRHDLEISRVSYKTVANVSSQLKQKLQASNLPELVSTAVKLLAAPS